MVRKLYTCALHAALKRMAVDATLNKAKKAITKEETRNKRFKKMKLMKKVRESLEKIDRTEESRQSWEKMIKRRDEERIDNPVNYTIDSSIFNLV